MEPPVCVAQWVRRASAHALLVSSLPDRRRRFFFTRGGRSTESLYPGIESATSRDNPSLESEPRRGENCVAEWKIRERQGWQAAGPAGRPAGRPAGGRAGRWAGCMNF